jgi:hypothetical protein
MDYLIKDIVLDDAFEIFKIYNIDNKKGPNLTNLSKINIFVGPNNSGKSRFTRLLSAIKQLKFTTTLNLDKIEELKINTVKAVNKFVSDNRYAEIPGISDRANSLKKYEYYDESTDIFQDISKIYENIYKPADLNVRTGNVIGPLPASQSKRFRDYLEDLYKDVQSALSALPKKISFKRLYIPTLRGLRPFSDKKDLYKDRTINDYFKEHGPEIFTGLSMYDTVHDLLVGDLDERESIVEFQNFLSETFFENREVALIPRKGSDVLFLKIGSEMEFPIYNLGDGIQSIIILTFPLFQLIEEELLVFIEEPEMFMHPGLQRIFLNTLSYFKKHQFFFTTHSNHFLELTFDYENISIYTFEKTIKETGEKIVSPDFKICNISNESRKTLELLGVRNSSVLLSNCTIWVEGITDRKYISHYLELYQNKLKSDVGKEDHFEILREDMHYSFVEYSGANITHWSFLEEEGSDTINIDYLCGKLFIITDKDDQDSHAMRHDKLKAKLDDRYYCLPVREIENLLTPEILRKVITDYEKSSPIFPEFKQDDYRDAYLGTFIEDTLLKGSKTRAGRYATESGTITQKIKFCDKAIDHIKTYDDLSPEAQELSKRLYDFIKNNNQ